MCGICGFINKDFSHPADRHIIERMNLRIRHRGPDSDGFFVRDNVALAMRRLAIIDVAGGDQPISNETGDIRIVFNGEIYNAPVLRKRLEGLGHRFSTRTDTEAILHLYEERGERCVEDLRGMFAFAIFDDRHHRLFLARDRLGKKPLYYADLPGVFIFGSELKCLTAHPEFPHDINPVALHHFLTLQSVPDPLSIYRAARKLPPACVLTFARGRIESVTKYWRPSFEPKLDLPLSEIKEIVRDKVREAVQIRMISEVPLGAHLSGGLDSAIVVGLMAEASSEPIRTFSIGFGEREFNETPFARKVAEKFATRHEEFFVEPDALELLPALVEAFDEPFGDPAAIPLWHLSRLTRQHVTVALNGDGGDEVFGGYQRYFADPWADAWRLMPVFFREKAFPAFARMLPNRHDRPVERNPVAALQVLAQAARFTSAASVTRWSSFFMEEEKADLYEPDFAASFSPEPSVRLIEKEFESADAKTRLDRTLAADLSCYLASTLLVKADRMTMSHSVEGRSPFLDHELVELAARLPTRLKVRGATTKFLLREIFSDFLPPGIACRGKQGFSVPLGPWFRGPLREPARDLLLEPNASCRTFFRHAAVEEVISQHERGAADYGKKLWLLLNLEVWLRRVREQVAG